MIELNSSTQSHNSYKNKKKNNIPNSHQKNIPSKELVYTTSRIYITKAQVRELCEKKYRQNGKGIGTTDICIEYNKLNKQAQSQLKHLHNEKFLFTGDDLKRQGINVKRFKRKNPQEYFLTEMKAKIIEDNKKNILRDTTEIGLIGQQKIQYLKDNLMFVSSSSFLYIHKIQIETIVDKKYYDDILITPEPVNNCKIWWERIGQPQHTPNVNYVIYPTGTVMINIACSNNPFRLCSEEDVSVIMVFLGRVEDRLRTLFSDTRDEIVKPVRNWILKQCDVNKDGEIGALTQITLNDIVTPLFEKGLRWYVKLIGNKAFLE
jgi:hypothetical protein